MSPERPVPALRASDADRDRTIDRLQRASLEGRLDAEEREDRAAAASPAGWQSALWRRTADVTPPPPGSPPMPAPYPYVPAPAQRAPTNGLAVASLVAAL